MDEVTKEWLDRKIREYNENKDELLMEVISDTNYIIEQFINNPNSIASFYVLESCMKSNKLLLNKIKGI